MINRKGFTLVELVIYVGIFGIIAAFLVGTLITAVRVENRELVSNELSQQLKFVLDTVSRQVRDSSLIDKVYEGTDEDSTCATFCAVKLRMKDSTLDPTVIRSDATAVYMKQGTNAEMALTNTKVTINSLILSKSVPGGGKATLQIDASVQYVSTNPQLAITRTLSGAVGRVSAATFDSDLVPDSDNLRSIGQTPSLKWKYGRFSSDVSVGGSLGVGLTAPTQKVEVDGGLRLNTATSKPTCDSTTRGTFWVTQSGAGVKDSVQVCAKDDVNAYAWRTIY